MIMIDYIMKEKERLLLLGSDLNVIKKALDKVGVVYKLSYQTYRKPNEITIELGQCSFLFDSKEKFIGHSSDTGFLKCKK